MKPSKPKKRNLNYRQRVHTPRTKTIFNGPIHGYIGHVTLIVAYQVTNDEAGRSRSDFFGTPAPDLPVEIASEGILGGKAVPDGPEALLSPRLEHSVFETEFRKMSPTMQRYIKSIIYGTEERSG